jgi:hypothetical protein
MVKAQPKHAQASDNLMARKMEMKLSMEAKEAKEAENVRQETLSLVTAMKVEAALNDEVVAKRIAQEEEQNMTERMLEAEKAEAKSEEYARELTEKLKGEMKAEEKKAVRATRRVASHVQDAVSHDHDALLPVVVAGRR